LPQAPRGVDLKLLVVTYKRCRALPSSPTGYATDGGFPLQMRALSELFDATTLLMEDGEGPAVPGDVPLDGRHMTIRSLPPPARTMERRKAGLLLWTPRNLCRLLRAIRSHDAVHTPVPCDTGTIAMLLAWILRKPLYVRYCGNWFASATTAERFWKWFMAATAGGRRVMLATGGALEAPAPRNRAVRWIFSTSLTAREMTELAVPRVPPREVVRLVTVGRQEAGKGTDRVIRALPLLHARGVDAVLDIAGDGGALPALRELAESLGLGDRVVFHGRLRHEGVLDLLRRADLFCFPTDSEGFPKAVLEALAAGLPVVTTPVSVLPLLLAEGGGVVLPDPAPEALADAVHAIVRDASCYTAMSRAAAATAATYTLEAWQERLRQDLSAAWGPLRDD
jgi:glycosyltransferase involved in cell wall biosynthesis